MRPDVLEALVNAARGAVVRAYAPYSEFRVGAAVLGASGRLYTGANIESSSYGLTVCAERVAVFHAVHAGESHLLGLAIATETQDPVSPCGACRQVVHEFGPDIPVLLSPLAGAVVHTRLGVLLPDAFDPRVLPVMGGRGPGPGTQAGG